MITVFWDVTPSSVVDRYLRFGGTSAPVLPLSVSLPLFLCALLESSAGFDRITCGISHKEQYALILNAIRP
jgi:hypothetical protein